MLRLLQYQEDHFVETDQRTLGIEGLLAGNRGSVGRNIFAIYCSTWRIYLGFLPKIAYRSCRPKDVDAYTYTEPSVGKLRYAHSLIDFARKLTFIDYGKKKNEKGILEEKEDRIRISTNGDQFVTIGGGIEELIKTFPRLWGIVALSLVPWLFTNKQEIVDFMVRVIRIFNN